MTYKIDEIDKRILFELDKNSRIPDTKLAKIVRKSKESVRYRIKKLIDEEIILGFTTWIDPTKLGYQTAKIYLTLANIPEKKKAFIEYVKKDKRLFWLGVAEGAWNVGLTFFVRSNQEYFDLKNKLFSKFKDLIIESQTGSIVSIYFQDKNFLQNQQSSWNMMFEKKETIELDKISKGILKSLFNNSRENIAFIAEVTNSTIDKVRIRMKRLQEQKIIVRYTVNINYKKLGYEFYKTFLYFKNLSSEDLDKLMGYVENQPNTINLIKQISPWDIELETLCKGYEAYNKILTTLTKEFSHIIRRTETAIISEDYLFPSKKMIFE